MSQGRSNCMFYVGWVALVALLPSIRVSAGSGVRYALVIGNNVGHTSSAQLDNLQYAETEAVRLREQLIRYGNFDAERVLLVKGGTRQEILKAAQQLAQLHQQDQAQFGSLPTLFALFFTGHGLAGKLLTADDPLNGEDLAGIFRQMNASLTLGFFDACFAGSFDWEALRGKGVVSTPGFNPVAELPEELLNSEGTLWFVSSRPDELSYEDERLGGLFTHFFIEAFTQASPDGIGVTLDSMWEYARRRTLAHAARYGRNQTPEKIVRKLKARGPLYFSFPTERNALLVFDAAVEGTFVLRYEYGELVEKVEKTAGQPKEVAVYEGKLVLSRIDIAAHGKASSQELNLSRGDEVRIRPQGLPLPAHGAGYTESAIRSKGQLPGFDLTQPQPRWTFVAGVGYRFSLPSSRLIGANHLLNAALWAGDGPLSFGIGFAYGSAMTHYQTWSYRLNQTDLSLNAGWGFDLGGLRLDAELDGGISWMDMRYGNGDIRRPVGGWVGAGPRLVVPLPLKNPWLVISARALLRCQFSEGLAVNDQKLYVAANPIFELVVSLPILGF